MDLFVYGTLLIPELRNALLKKELSFEEATLQDYLALTYYIGKRETEYPVLIPSSGDCVKGLILKQLTKEDIQVLSYYEGDDYFLSEIEVIQSSKNFPVKIFMHKKLKSIKPGSKWQLENFRKNHLQHYLKGIISDD